MQYSYLINRLFQRDGYYFYHLSFICMFLKNIYLLGCVAACKIFLWCMDSLIVARGLYSYLLQKRKLKPRDVKQLVRDLRVNSYKSGT